MSDSFGDRITGAISILTLGAGLIALFAGFDWFWIVFVIGWVVLTPLAGVLFGSNDEEWVESNGDWVRAENAENAETTDDAAGGTGQGSKQDALERLRERYASGELSDEQFERKLERLLETDTLENAREYVGDGDEATTFEDIRDREREREYGTEYE
jgi:uncharacterized membrane protein